MRVEDINLLDRDVFAKGVPHEWFTHLREHHPVFHHSEPRGPGFWVVSKYADVQAAGRDPVVKTTATLGLTLLQGKYGTTAGHFGSIMGGALLGVVPMLILYFFGQKYFVQGLARTGLKG